jgi:hypothetical protein
MIEQTRSNSAHEAWRWKSETMVLRYAHVNVAHLAQSIAALPWETPGRSKARRINLSSLQAVRACCAGPW